MSRLNGSENELRDSRIGERSLIFRNMPVVTGAAAIAGVKEGKGQQAEWFDLILQDDYYGEKTFEKAESKMLRNCIVMAAEKAGQSRKSLEMLFAGDLLNQLMSSSYMARDLGIPYLGMYGACSTMTQSLTAAAMAVDGGYAANAAAAASSHFATAERQFRLPLEHASQRPPQAQWTATAAGAMIISRANRAPSAEAAVRITHATVGRVIDPGITDTNSMGAAMAPAAYDTIRAHLKDCRRTASDYDLILTGDLGKTGSKILLDLSSSKIPGLREVYDDCGASMYFPEQDSHAGGSGCGCSASVMAGRIYKEMKSGRYRRVMLVSTGALISTISTQQGETVPGIAHAVTLEVH